MRKFSHSLSFCLSLSELFSSVLSSSSSSSSSTFLSKMELALSLGDSTKQSFRFLDKPSKINPSSSSDKDLGFCMGLDVGFGGGRSLSSSAEHEKATEKDSGRDSDRFRGSSTDPPLQLDLLPFSPVPRSHPPNQLRFPWLQENIGNEPGFSDGPGGRMLAAAAAAAAEEEAGDGAVRLSASPPNSVTSSFQLDFGIRSHGNGKGKRDEVGEAERSGSRASDDDENGSTRKKLRLSKEQSAFLEESFKEHNTLNPKQKLALAKQLNLRPRQVEVWFQNRRARTKLKQTEVDCEYLKRCCESLTEENRRLQKELQELRALKTSRPFYMQLPATTLTMCPSCERVATTTTTAAPATFSSSAAAASSAGHNPRTSASSSCPFGPVKVQAHQAS